MGLLEFCVRWEEYIHSETCQESHTVQLYTGTGTAILESIDLLEVNYNLGLVHVTVRSDGCVVVGFAIY